MNGTCKAAFMIYLAATDRELSENFNIIHTRVLHNLKIIKKSISGLKMGQARPVSIESLSIVANHCLYDTFKLLLWRDLLLAIRNSYSTIILSADFIG